MLFRHSSDITFNSHKAIIVGRHSIDCTQAGPKWRGHFTMRFRFCMTAAGCAAKKREKKRTCLHNTDCKSSGSGTPCDASVACDQSAPPFITGTGERCSACPPGKYKDFAGPMKCIPCPPGFFADGNASTTCRACPAPALYTTPGSAAACGCNAGFAADSSGGCVRCRPGQYKDVVGPGPCVDCPNNTLSSEGARCAAAFDSSSEGKGC